ncbi:MAG TPA: penicillin-binding protein 2 [Actinomycetota bacterium]
MSGIDDRIRLRMIAVSLVIAMLFAVLLTRLWFLQVLAGQEFAAAARNNSVRIVSVEAPRGRILDRKGRVLVRNRTALAIGIRADDLPDDRRDARAVKERLAKLLGVTVKFIDERLADVRTSPYKPVVIADDVPLDVVFAVRERAHTDFQGVESVSIPVRRYPHGRLASHILGYVAETSEADLDRLGERYRLGDSIGKTGVESVYERFLRGQPGLDKLEVDATGTVLRRLGGRQTVPGADVRLTIDLDVQRVAEQALAQGIASARTQTFHATGARFRAPAGAAVVIDVETGDVIAMASFPTFDLRRFVGGVDAGYWERLNDPGADNPLLNRTIQATYPPGSTFKPVLATAALEQGDASPGRLFPCKTEFEFGDRIFRNWQPRDASITLEQSLVESCDTVYYTLARDWWLREEAQASAGKQVYETMQDWARRFGLGSPTGIDLPAESPGRIPDRASKRSTWEANEDEYCDTARRTQDPLFVDLCNDGWRWRGGDAVNMSIGQGEVEASPLQMAVAYAAVANGGTVVTPHVVAEIAEPGGKRVKKIEPAPKGRIKADASAVSYVNRALGAVAERGTGLYPYRGWPFSRIPVAAKTGSAEIVGRQPFSWFASYAPLNRPKYAVVAMVEEGGFGSQVAGPVVRRIMDELFGRPPLPIVYGTAVSD